MTIHFFEVGGCVRDEIMGIESHDIDFAVEARDFAHMQKVLIGRGFTIFLSNPEFFTIRARFPKGQERGGMTADFVLARKETGFSDGRHPDRVERGTIYDDLARRDFTMNAMARDVNGILIDPFNGVADIEAGIIRAVGNADDRIKEDALRILRALRFSVTKGFDIDFELNNAIRVNQNMLTSVSVERIREELHKMFMHDTFMAMQVLREFPIIRQIVFIEMGIRLKPTLEK